MTTDLVGIWSADALFAPGAQEDEMLVFRSDGTGWIEWMNFGAHEIEFFEWTPTSPGWVVVASRRKFGRDLHNLKLYTEREPTFGVEHLSFLIEEVETPLCGSMLQLEVRLPGSLAGFYGLIEKDADCRLLPEMPA